MKKLFFLMGMLCLGISINAQDQFLKEAQSTALKSLEEDTTHKQGWKKGAVYSLGIGQGGSVNWAAGAEKFSLSLSSNILLFANYKRDKVNWRNSLEMGYALVNTTSQGVRKTDDKIDFYSKYGYDLSKKISASFVGNLRSQFTAGYDYDYLGEGLKRRTSGWFAPAYMILAPGFDYHPTQSFSVFFSPVSFRSVFVTNDPKSYYYPNATIPGGGFETPLAVLYGVDPARKVRAEVGGFVSMNFVKEVLKNVAYKSRLDLYSNYLKTYNFEVTGPDQLVVTKNGANPEKVDIFWTNLIAMKVNKFLSVNFSADLIYDDDVRQFGENGASPATQFRSQLTIGLAGRF